MKRASHKGQILCDFTDTRDRGGVGITETESRTVVPGVGVGGGIRLRALVGTVVGQW